MSDAELLRLALRLARRGLGCTSPNPMVGAVLVKDGKVIGRGWHRKAGAPHAEVEAIRDAERRCHSVKGATLYVTLEPCCTHGRTPPCTEAIIAAGIRRVVIGAADPNPRHSGRAFKILRRAGVRVDVPREGRRCGTCTSRSGRHLETELQTVAGDCIQLNEAFNHWIVSRTPLVTVKAAMTLDGKIATAHGESKWITSEQARNHAMKLRRSSDAILVGINTVLADDPSLTARSPRSEVRTPRGRGLRRIILDSMARTPLNANVVRDEYAPLTTIVVSNLAAQARIAALKKRVCVRTAPLSKSAINIRWLLRWLGREGVTRLLVEGGGEVNASFLLGGFAQQVAFFYAPKILGGKDARKAVAGEGVANLSEVIELDHVQWRRLGPDLVLTARVRHRRSS